MIAAAGGGSGGARPAMFPPRALERAVIRTLHDDIGLVVGSQGVSDAALTAEAILAAAGEGALILPLAGPGGARGVAALTAPLASMLVLRRLTGRLPDAAAPGRPFSRTDAAIVATSVDRILAAFAAALEGSDAAGWARGFAVDGHIGEPRLLGFWLPEAGYRGFDLRLSLRAGEADEDSGLILALPREQAGRGGKAGRGRAPFPTRLGDRLMDSELPLEAVLARLTLALPRVSAFAPGTVLELPGRALTSLRLEAAGGALVAEGRLGRLHGERAMKLTRLAGSPAAAADASGPALSAPGSARNRRPAPVG